MNRNPYWVAYLVLIGLVVLGYSGFAGYKLYQYSRLTEQQKPQSIHWSINKLQEDDYVLQAFYEYSWKGKNYTGHMNFNQHFLNAWASREALDKLNSESFTVWLDPNKPSFSTLDKAFPVKYLIYACVLWLLFFYFVWLGSSVKRVR